MYKFIRIVPMLASLCMASSFAVAAELKPFQTEAKVLFDSEVEAPLKATNDACGTTLTVKTNFELYSEAEWSVQSISNRCKGVLDAVQSLCERPAYKSAVAQKIKEVHCLFGGKSGETEETTLANMSVTGSAMIFKMHPSNSNVNDAAKKTLEDFVNK